MGTTILSAITAFALLAVPQVSKTPTTAPEIFRDEAASLVAVAHAAEEIATSTVSYIVTLTAYSSAPEETDDTPFITASNTRTRDGIVATNFLPFGTKIKIPEYFGDKVFTVEDRMHRRKEGFVDIWMPTKSAALKFGIAKAAEIVVVD